MYNILIKKYRAEFLVCLILIAATIPPYWQVTNHPYMQIDDDKYVASNPRVLSGLTLQNTAWAFTSGYASNWHPLTWISLMIDREISDRGASIHHRMNLFFHCANVLLLFLVLRGLTGGLWKSGFVAMLFALHPMHVESVAWITERKDLLCAFFWFLTIGAYHWYVKHRTIWRYLLVVVCFVLGLLSKPMMVTIPFVLLLLDFWPLGRIQGLTTLKTTVKNRGSSYALPLGNLVLEKMPLLLFSIGACIITFIVQEKAGAVGSMGHYPADARITNAIVSYSAYLVKMITMTGLSVYYPHPHDNQWSFTALSLGFLLIISVVSIMQYRRCPYFPTGWFWYLGTLVPVIGIVQVGGQAMADRYTYLPFVGIFITFVWSTSSLAARFRIPSGIMALITSAITIALMISTARQAGYWRDSITLLSHAVAVTKNNSYAHNNLGIALGRQGRYGEAIMHYNEALRIVPENYFARNNLGNILRIQGRLDEAVLEYRKSLHLKPDYSDAHNNLAIVLADLGKTEEAIEHYSEALRYDFHNANIHFNKGLSWEKLGTTDSALASYQKALHINPFHAKAHFCAGNLLEKNGDIKNACLYFEKALQLEPDFILAEERLKNVGAR